MSAPNVLCFVLDQLRYDHLGCTGNETVETPTIDALADDGVVMDRAYVNNPLCMPARASLLTGLMPRDHGVRTNGIPLDRDATTLSGTLSEAGYRTYAAGKLHFHTYDTPHDVDSADADPAEFPEAKPLWESGRIESLSEPFYGFDEVDFTGGHVDWIFGEYVRWLEDERPSAAALLDRGHERNGARPAPDAFDWAIDEADHYNRWIADRTRSFLRERAEDDEPFFAWCSFPDPHHPFAAPDPWDDLYDPDDVSPPTRREGELDDLPPFYRDAFEDEETVLSGRHGSTDLTDAELREQIALTYGMVSFVDQEIGRVMETLAETGLREDTIVVFMSDHGDMMGDHWMVRKGPFHFEGLLRVPMIWSWPGEFPVGERTDGLAEAIDFAPTVLDCCGVAVPEGVDEPFLDERDGAPPALPGRSLRPQLAGERDAVREAVIVENDEDYLGLRPRSLITDRYKLTVYPGRSYGELFDLDADPEELHNRWDDPGYADAKADLYRQFVERYVEHEQGLPRRICHA
jgi:arylsulfatase